MSTALITGASGDIGSELARRFAALGHDICVGYSRSVDAAEALAQELCMGGIKAAAVRFDLSDLASPADSYARCVRLLGEPTLLINNGGCEEIGLFQDMTDRRLIEVMNTDLVGTMLLTKLAVGHMVSAHRGCVINIASVWGETGASCETAYSAAKAGLIGFTRALGKELAPCGVRVNAVSPGFIDTKMNAAFSEAERGEIVAAIPADRAGTPKDIADAAEFLASDKAAYICGQVLRVDGGWI